MQSSKEWQGETKKALLSDQCKEIEENNRMGKTTGLFKKMRDTKGTFHAPRLGIEPVCPVLAGRFLNTESPGKP